MESQHLRLTDLFLVTGIIALALASFIVFSQIIGLQTILEQQQHKSLWILGLLIIQNLLFLLPITLFVLIPRKISLKTLGFRKVSIIKTISYVLIGFISFIAISTTINSIQLLFDIQIPGFGQQFEHLPLFGEGIFNLLIAFITIVILAPIFEEIIFRGYLFQTLANYFSPKIAIPLAGFIFAISHLELNVILPLWILGTLICYIFYKTKSIYVTIAFHIFNNSLAFGLEYWLL